MDKPTTPSDRGRLGVLALSAVVGIALAALLYRYRRANAPPSEHGAVVVNKSASTRAELTARAAQGAPRPITGPATAEDFPAPYPERAARELLGALANSRVEFDPLVLCRAKPNDLRRHVMDEDPLGGWIVTTNDIGAREDLPLSRASVDLRVIVTGDSNVAGVCPNRESFANLTERLLSTAAPGRTIDVLNLGTGATGPVCYMGWPDSLPELDFDLHVAVVYGGNDFTDMALALRWDRRLGPHSPPGELTRQHYASLRDEFAIVGAIQLAQIVYFASNPDDRSLAVFGLNAMALAMQHKASARGAELLCVYLPPPFTVRAHQRAVLESWGSAHGLTAEQLFPDQTMAEEWIAFLGARGIACLDLREALTRAPGPCYWKSDQHLNLHGHKVVARELTRTIRERFGQRLRAAPRRR